MIHITDTIESVELQTIQIIVEHKLSKYELHGLQNLEVGRYIDHMTDSVCFRFRAFCLGEDIKPIRLSPQPTSWWQMFKRDCMPKWFVKLFPVKSSEVVIDGKILYPYLNFKIGPKHSTAVVRFAVRPGYIGGTH